MASADIDSLPNCCALVAMAACYQLGRHGIICRPLGIKYQRKPVRRHIVTMIEFGGRIHVYDDDGTATLPPKITSRSTPLQIARAWKPLAGFDKPVLGAEWYGE